MPTIALYLFGRGQDIGFEKAIGDSPRKRHHVRFWASSLAHASDTAGTAGFWLNRDRPPRHSRVVWVGAGTMDTGFSLTKLTFQLTHATDADTDLERDYIIAELARHRLIADVTAFRAGQQLAVGRVNRYITDGQVTLADLT